MSLGLVSARQEAPLWSFRSHVNVLARSRTLVHAIELVLRQFPNIQWLPRIRVLRHDKLELNASAWAGRRAMPGVVNYETPTPSAQLVKARFAPKEGAIREVGHRTA